MSQNKKTVAETVEIFSALPIDFEDRDVIIALAEQWVDGNIGIEYITDTKIAISWDRSYHYKEDSEDCINNGRITCDITENNLWAIIDNDINGLEGDFEYFFQYQENKYVETYSEKKIARIGGIMHTHKSELVCVHGSTSWHKYPITLLSLLKGEMVEAPEYVVSLYGKEAAAHYHKITNFQELPEWIPDSEEYGWFEG